MINWLFIIGIFSALGTILSNNMVYSIIFLALYALICGITLIVIGAEFLGYMVIIIYVGAVIILFLFVVMMMEIEKEEVRDARSSPHSNVLI